MNFISKLFILGNYFMLWMFHMLTLQLKENNYVRNHISVLLCKDPDFIPDRGRKIASPSKNVKPWG